MATNKWLTYQHPDVLAFHVANEGISARRNNAKAFGAKRKAKGVKAGVPDWVILEPRNEYHGMMIELKVKGGSLSPSQKLFLKRSEASGYYVAICWSLQEFVYHVTKYLGE